LSDFSINDWTEQNDVVAVWLTLWINGFECLPGYRSLLMCIIVPLHFAKSNHTVTRTVYTHVVTRTLVFQTADINRPNSKPMSSVPLFQNYSPLETVWNEILLFLGLTKTPSLYDTDSPRITQ
jgi:hypothetical protein